MTTKNKVTGKKLTVADLTVLTSDELGTDRSDTYTVVSEFLRQVKNQIMQGNGVMFPGLVNFTVKEVPPRTIHNPRTKEFTEYPAAVNLKVSASAVLKGNVKKHLKPAHVQNDPTPSQPTRKGKKKTSAGKQTIKKAKSKPKLKGKSTKR